MHMLPLAAISAWGRGRGAPRSYIFEHGLSELAEVQCDGAEGYNGHGNESGERQAWRCSESKLARFLVVVQTLSEPPTVTVHGAYARFHMLDFCQHSYELLASYESHVTIIMRLLQPSSDEWASKVEVCAYNYCCSHPIQFPLNHSHSHPIYIPSSIPYFKSHCSDIPIAIPSHYHSQCLQ